MTAEATSLSAREALERYAVLFWQNGIGRFAGRTFRDHEGQERSVADTLRLCKRELEEASHGSCTGLVSALRDMATLKELLDE